MRGKKWVPYGENKMQYSLNQPRGLWWWDELDIRRRWDDPEDPRTQKRRERVVNAYVRQVARGRAVDQKQLKKDLLKWIQELVEPLEIYRGYEHYWMLPYYAKVHGLHPYTFMKRFREMEKIAKRLFPERVPYDLKAKPVTEELKHEIRDRYLQLKWDIHFSRKQCENEDAYQTFRHKEAIKRLMKEFEFRLIPLFRLGQICREVRRVKRWPRLKKSSDGHYRFPREL
jgi:hypothetical protein